jgi:hypothetical protein
MFEESIRILTLINSGERKSWDILQRMEMPVKRFRIQIKRLLDLHFVGFKENSFEYFLTNRGENVLRSLSSNENDVGESPFILIKR